MKKVGIYSLIFLLVFSMIPMPSIDSVSAESEEETEDIVLFAEEEGDDINLYSSEEDVEADESEIDIPDESEALLIHNDSTFEYEDQLYVYIQYEDEDIEDDTDQLVEGYVDAERVVLAENVEEFLENRQQGEETESDDHNSDDEAEEAENDESSEGDDGNAADSEENDESVKEDEENTDSEENDDISEEEDTNASEENDESTDNNDEESDENKSEELDEEDEFNPSPYATQNARNIVEKKTSKLARINNDQVNIYESIGGESKKAGSEYTSITYYVKKQATQGEDIYYLISEKPKASIVGWVKSEDVESFDHKSVDKKSKTFYVKGNGNARSKAWGAKKDHVYSDLSKYAGETFKVHLTEKVGNNTWYRGKLDGKTVWLHSNFVTHEKEIKTSKLARINNSEVNIYEVIGGKSKKAGSKYTDITYYVKKQTKQGADTYYLISEDPNSNIVGWVKSGDVESFDHKSVDKKSKTFYVKGNGNARSKAWGAKKDHVYSDLSQYAGEIFEVNLTEKVGNNTWYRGKLDGKTVWLHSNFVTKTEISKTSKLARINDSQVNIFESVGGKSKKADSKYTDVTYYVKKQTKQGTDTYYLISEDPKSNIVGWVKSSDVESFTHKSVDKKSKTFFVKGNGNARSKAWGAKKDRVYSDLSKYAGETFKVHLTEKVGNNTWYRGKLDGKTVWLHSNFVTQESKTSKLARINNGQVNIYESIGGESKKAGSKYTDVTYYVKNQAVQDNEIYYLISEDPNSNIVGWVKSGDVESFDHKSVDKKSKTFYVKGNGNARSKAWGAKKDHVYSDLSKYAGETFKVHLTEKVGNNTWYRGKLDGKTVWLHSNFVSTVSVKYTNYNLTLIQAINLQYKQNPQIQKNGKWQNASKSEIKKYMNPKNFIDDPKQRFQFLDLSKPSGASKSVLNNHLKGKGILNNQGETFYNASRKHGINDLYLIAHAQLETGNGTSDLASGVEVGMDKNENLKLVTKSNKSKLKKIKTTYNMFGIGAVDSDALAGGAKTAYAEGWFTPEAAIDGGAKWISNQYIQNKHNQNTIYKMRWNPNMNDGYAYKQYATDIAWASKQVDTIYNIYEEIGFTDSMSFDYPEYK